MTVTAWIVVAVLGAVLLFCLGWRWASRVWSLPCPTLLAWALEAGFRLQSIQGGWWLFTANFVKPGETPS